MVCGGVVCTGIYDPPNVVCFSIVCNEISQTQCTMCIEMNASMYDHNVCSVLLCIFGSSIPTTPPAAAARTPPPTPVRPNNNQCMLVGRK